MVIAVKTLASHGLGDRNCIGIALPGGLAKILGGFISCCVDRIRVVC